MPLPIYIEFNHGDYPKIRIRQLKEMTREAHRSMGLLWAYEMLPQHFTERGRLLYGYKPRTAKYMKRKIRLAAVGKAEDGGRSPLVLTGALRRSALRSRYLVRAYPTRVTIPVIGPSYFTSRPRRTNAPNMGAEVVRVAPSEIKKLTEAARRGFNRKLAQLPAGRKILFGRKAA